MNGNATAIRHGEGERGQVLILAIVALILVIIATLLLFDIQTVIRGKIKGQNGADAAALTAAEWQKHSLNLIGELNLVRATGTLISDPFFANGVLHAPANQSNAAEFFSDLPQPITQETFTLFPEKSEFYNPDGTVNVEKLIGEVVRVEKQKRYLDNLDDLVSQLQTRISFVGPLIAFGAAQQAAKNNGINYDRECSDFFIQYLNLVGNDGIYEHLTPVFVNDYAWRTPYTYMLNSILDYSAYRNEYTNRTEEAAYGIAAGTRFKFIGMPTLTANPPTDMSYYLGDKNIYDIAFSESADPYDTASGRNGGANALQPFLRNGERLFSETYNGLEPYEYTVTDDVSQTEEHSDSKHVYRTLTNITINLDQPLETYNDGDADRRYDLLPRLSWAIFDDEWTAYDNSSRQEWNKYLFGDFKAGNDYTSGARAYFEINQDTVTITGTMGRPRSGARGPDVGQVFASSDTNGEAQRVSGTLNRLNNSVTRIETSAAAKPVGQIRAGGSTLRPFEAGRMVLPVFTDTALMPIALEPVEGFSMGDIDWLFFLTEFIPILAESPSLEDAWHEAASRYPNHLGYYSYYYYALLLLNNPNFRQAGINWLDATAVWGRDENGNRYPLYTNREVNCTGRSGGSGGSGWGGTNRTNGGPSSLH